MAGAFTAEQEYWWRIALELKMRQCSGDAFQVLFSTIMEKCHGSDFIRVRSFGSRGDKGCDGYLQSTGQVFQCYGAINGESGKVDYLVKKMEEDFAKALDALPNIMKEWHFVHNLVGGLPVHAIEKLESLRKINPKHKIGLIAKEGLEERIFALDPNSVAVLLGPVPTSSDAQSLETSELRELISSVARSADELSFDVTAIRPVPPEKLAFNNLPGHWRSLISAGWQNAHLVASYIDHHSDPMVGVKVAQVFRHRYLDLRAQGLQPDTIMAALLVLVTGIGHVTVQRQVAAQALLAYLFESCEIFEEPPSLVRS